MKQESIPTKHFVRNFAVIKGIKGKYGLGMYTEENLWLND